MKRWAHKLLGLGLCWLCLASPVVALTPLHVVSTFSILTDLTERVAGEAVTVHTLTPIGAEVHDWSLTPANFMALERAELVLANGLQLEQWMGQVHAVVRAGTPVVAVAERADWPTLPIQIGERQGQADPHVWMDPRAAAAYGWVIAEALSALRPDQAAIFNAGARQMEQQLLELALDLAQRLEVLPPAQRLLLTSEAAFHYFAEAYGFVHDGIWGNNAETEGSPRQLMRMIDLVRQHQPAALFWESTLSDRHVRQVAADTGVAVAGPLYVDSLGPPGSGAEDYLAMMQHNVAVIIAALRRD